MLAGEFDESVNVWLDGLHTALHGGNGIALPLKAYALSPYGAEVLSGQSGGTAAVGSDKVAAEDEDLIILQFRYPVRGEFSVVHGTRRL